MLLFDRIELNKETDCLEAYLEEETMPRTDIPDDPECIASLISLLKKYVKPTYKGALVTGYYIDDPSNKDSLRTAYISFGEYLETSGTDTFGIIDSAIYYYKDYKLFLHTLETDKQIDEFFITDYTLIEADN